MRTSRISGHRASHVRGTRAQTLPESSKGLREARAVLDSFTNVPRAEEYTRLRGDVFTDAGGYLEGFHHHELSRSIGS